MSKTYSQFSGLDVRGPGMYNPATQTGLEERAMTRTAVSVMISIFLLASISCVGDREDPLPVGMDGAYANCEYSVLTLRLPDGSDFELDINGLPVQEFWGAQLLCQPCDCPENWQVLRRRGVSLAVIFEAAGIETSDSTPVNFMGRDGWDPLRTVLGGDTGRIMNFGYLREFGYIYAGSPGLKDPSLPVDHPDNFAKDPLYPEMEGRSLCLDFDHENVLDAQVYASASGMEIDLVGCFGQFRYSMLEKYSDAMFGVIEVDPQP